MKRDARLYHSRYDPEREACRYLDSALGGRRPSLAVLIGPGLNYLGMELRKRLPFCRCVALQPDTAFDGKLVSEPDGYWSPASTIGPESCLRSALLEGWASGGVCVLEWEPINGELPVQSAALKTMVARELSKEAAASATSAHWSARWLKNAMRFSQSRARRCRLQPGNGPLVVACAGPSLETAIPALRKLRPSYSLWALSSANATLQAHGLYPDAVITSDPGFWASLHLRPSAAGKGSSPAMLMPPSAALPQSCLDSGPLAPFCSGSPIDDIALDATGDVRLGLAPSGTSSGSALKLALTAGSTTVFTIGLDLAAMDIIEHARGYAFLALDDKCSARLSPSHGTAYARAMDRYPERIGSWRVSRAFGSYAVELSDLFAVNPRLSRVQPSPLSLGGTSIPVSEFPSAIANAAVAAPPRFTAFDFSPAQGAAVAIVQAVLERASKALMHAADLKTPIKPDDASMVFSLGNRELALAVASAARGELSKAVLDDALKSINGFALNLERTWHG